MEVCFIKPGKRPVMAVGGLLLQGTTKSVIVRAGGGGYGKRREQRN